MKLKSEVVVKQEDTAVLGVTRMVDVIRGESVTEKNKRLQGNWESCLVLHGHLT